MIFSNSNRVICQTDLEIVQEVSLYQEQLPLDDMEIVHEHRNNVLQEGKYQDCNMKLLRCRNGGCQ